MCEIYTVTPDLGEGGGGEPQRDLWSRWEINIVLCIAFPVSTLKKTLEVSIMGLERVKSGRVTYLKGKGANNSKIMEVWPTQSIPTSTVQKHVVLVPRTSTRY